MAASTPLQRSFWFAEVDARPLALFRIALGLVLLRDWVEWFPDLAALYSTEGIFPHGGPMPPYRWSLFALTSGTTQVQLLWGVGLVALIAFTLGFLTRLVTAVAWLLLVSFHNRNMLVLTGGDRLVELLLLTSLFTRLGAAWSVDARLWPRAQRAPALGLRFMQLEVALLYFMTARLKLRGLWRHGDGIWISLQHPGFLRPPGALLLRFPALCRFLNYLVMGLEGLFPILAFSPVARRKSVPLAILCALAVQLGILMFIRVGSFTWVMLSLNLLWVEPEWIDALLRRTPLTVADPAPRPVTGRQWAASALLLAMVVLVSWDFILGTHLPMPSPMRMVHRGASLEQLFELFGVKYDVTRWEAVATTADGQSVEVLESTAPGLSPGPGWAYDPWYKLTFADELLDRPALGRWLCRRYTQSSGVALRSLSLRRHAHAPTLIGEPDAPESVTELWSGPCEPSL